MSTAPLTVQITGLPWYEAETFERVCALMHDKNALFRTHAEWLAAAQNTEKQLSMKGARTVRVTLDLVQFPAWCAAHRPVLHIDAQARMQYASFIAAQVHRADDSGPKH